MKEPGAETGCAGWVRVAPEQQADEVRLKGGQMDDVRHLEQQIGDAECGLAETR